MIVFLVSIFTFFSIFLGGVFAFKFKHHLNLLMAYSSGVILGVIVFEVLPEIFDLVYSTSINILYPMSFLLFGFLVFHFAEKVLLVHTGGEEEYIAHSHSHVGVFSSLTLILHSFLDGVGIGVGFATSAALGILIALAVILHEFADGLNIVSFMLSSKNSKNKTILFLIIASFAPFLGFVTTLFFTIPSIFIVCYLGYFAGSLLYICASDILPKAHSREKFGITFVLTIVGIMSSLVVGLFS